MIWNPDLETLPRPQMERLQTDRLVRLVHYAYANVPLYRRKFDEAGLKPEAIQSLEDLAKIPFTTKDDLRDAYPFGMFAKPINEIVRIHASSGTTGKSTVVGYSKEDLGVWSEVMARTLAGAGCTSADIVQNAYGYGLFTGGLGVHYGAERIGASVVPVSGGNTPRQLQLMQDFGSTLLCCTPSYAVYLGESAAEAGIDTSKLALKAGCFGAEPWGEQIRQEIETKLNLKAYDIYGLSEIIGPGVSFECEGQCGLHINEDHFLPEIIDPATGEQKTAGETGELVFTTLTKTGMPLLRYRTRDLCTLDYEPCACGRSTVRMSKIKGRTDDMLVIRGVNVFPSQVEAALLELDYVEPHYQIIVDREAGKLDTLEVQVEVSEKMFSDEVSRMVELEQELTQHLSNALNVSCQVKLVGPKTIARSEGKAKRVIDKREIR